MSRSGQPLRLMLFSLFALSENGNKCKLWFSELFGFYKTCLHCVGAGLLSSGTWFTLCPSTWFTNIVSLKLPDCEQFILIPQSSPPQACISDLTVGAI